MADGIFPFKVVESVASGRLVISTKLPTTGLEDVLQGVQFVDHSMEAFLGAIEVAQQTYCGNIKAVIAGASEATRLFDEAGVLSALDHLNS